MSDELKPCPFCGSEVFLKSNMWKDSEGYMDKHEWVDCHNCIGDKNADRWNTRPLEDAKDARIAELEETIRGICEAEEENNKPCEWTYDRDMESYETGCGEAFVFEVGSLTENSVHFCQACGRKIVEVIPESEDEDE